MRIEFLSASPDRAGKYLVRLDDGSSLRFYRQTVEDFGLYAGLELTEKQFASLKEAAGRMSAKMRAVRIVAATSVSKSDLEQRLIRKGEDPEQAREAVKWMTVLEFVDDRQTAEQIVSRCIAKGYGISRAKQALYEKKIPKQFWESVLEDYPDQTEKLVTFLRSRLGENPTEKDTKRAIDALLRRGHKWSDCRQALRQVALEAVDFQEEEYG